MKPSPIVITVAGALLLFLVLLAPIHPRAQEGRDEQNDEQGDDDSRVAIGLRIAPVHLSFRQSDREAVGLGSYLVNAVGGCNDCHTCPSYEPGHNPYGPPFGPPGGGDGRINSVNYLAGGVVFDPPGVTSANLTPVNGFPEGHTFAEFKRLIRTGRDPDEPDHILQVMPWPIYRNMSDDDLRAIYAFLRAIPPAQPGQCVAPGQ
jgi:hypothetical protein